MRPGDDDLEVLPVHGLDAPIAEAPPAAAPAAAPAARPRVPITDFAPGAGLAPAAALRPPPPRYRAAVIATTVLFLAAVAGLLVVPGTEAPAQTLARVTAFVRSERTARFTDDSTTTYGPAAAGELGHTSTNRSRAAGEIRLPDESHVVVDEGGSLSEQVVVEQGAFARWGDSRGDLAAASWVPLPRPSELLGRLMAHSHEAVAKATPDGNAIVVGNEASPEIGAALEAADGFFSATSFPLDLGRLFDRLTDVEHAGAHRLHGKAKAADLLPPEYKAFIPAGFAALEATIDVAVVYGGGGRLDALTLEYTTTFDDDRETERHDVRFRDWGVPVDIAAPVPSLIDRTPTIDEARLARVADMTVLAPTPVPSPWTLASAEVQERDEEVEECGSVTLTYLRADVDSAAYLGRDDDPPTVSITSVPVSCPWLENVRLDAEGARTVAVGAATALIVDNVDDNTYAYLGDGVTAALTIGSTYVLASTNAGEPVLLGMLGALAPLDLSAQPIGAAGAEAFFAGD